MLAEDVWDFYMAWVEHLPRCRSRLEDMEESMWEILQQFEFDISGTCTEGRTLANTPRPVWYPTCR